LSKGAEEKKKPGNLSGFLSSKNDNGEGKKQKVIEGKRRNSFRN